MNRGILECFENGILRSASLMPNGEAFDDAVGIARQTPGLGIGIHFALVGEPCVAQRHELGRLVDGSGLLPASYTAFARGYFTRRFTLSAVRREVTAQMERALATGLHLTHVDSHQHIHLLPGIFDIISKAARDAGISVIRVPRDRSRKLHRRRDARGVQLRILTALCRRANRQARAYGLRTARHFFGLDVSGALDERALLDMLHNVAPGVNEIMAHPGISDAALRGKYQWGYAWDAEARALQSPTICQMIEQRGIRLAHFGEAWKT